MSKGPRIVSLLPSATEIAVALGLGENLVGRSHECDYPSWVERLPVCTATKLKKGLRSRQIDDRVQEIVRQGLSVYEVDAQLLRSLEPDLILTQSQCAVCAVTPADLKDAVAEWIGTPPTLLSLAPDKLVDVWDDIRSVADAAGVADRARPLLDTLQERLAALDAWAAPDRPTVVALEWIDPLMAAGNWIPELIELAGGRPLLMSRGEHSRRLGWDELAKADPDVIILMPCGFRISQSLAELETLHGRAEWPALGGVRDGRVFIADGQYFFNRPGPRLVESAQMVAQMLAAPARSRGSEAEGWVRA